MSRLFFGPTVELRGLGGVIARDLQIELQIGAPRPLSLLQLVPTSPLPVAQLHSHTFDPLTQLSICGS